MKYHSSLSKRRRCALNKAEHNLRSPFHSEETAPLSLTNSSPLEVYPIRGHLKVANAHGQIPPSVIRISGTGGTGLGATTSGSLKPLFVRMLGYSHLKILCAKAIDCKFCDPSPLEYPQRAHKS